ncbi:MAG: DUF2309 domain-containing protein [Gammaproteobacteria bacterium]
MIRKTHSPREEILQRLRGAIQHMEHVLPGQAAIKDFVHHNTLHGFEHLPFAEAVEKACEITGNFGYLPQTRFRALFKQGRITLDELRTTLDETANLKASDIIFKAADRDISQADIYLARLLHPIKPVTGCQINWQLGELNALHAFQPDIDSIARERLLKTADLNEHQAIFDLWSACLHILGLDHFIAHPEDMLDLTPEKAESMLSQTLANDDHPDDQPVIDFLIRKHARRDMDKLFSQIGEKLTLEGMLKKLTGEDLLEQMRPLLIRYMAAFLDQGFSAWPGPGREEGFYTFWRKSAVFDKTSVFDDFPDWADTLDALPEDAFDTVVIELRWLGIDEGKWESYLQRLALELPGWSGMFLWRHNRPGYDGLTNVNVNMMDYLAVRLVLERLFAQRLCRNLWQIEASIDVIRWYFKHHLAEFMVRQNFYNQHLPEYLSTLAQNHLNCSDICTPDEQQWWHLAHLIWTWQHSTSNGNPSSYNLFNSAWPLFRLSQHLGLSDAEIRKLDITQIDRIFNCLKAMDKHQASFIWLQAYERHYRDQLFNAVIQNHGRGLWKTRDKRPDAQIVFCMDDREEGMRRHLEEHNPDIETLGAGGFFGLPINWLGLDDEQITPLCPVVATPSYEIQEHPQPHQEALLQKRKQRLSTGQKLQNLVFQETRRNLLVTTCLVLINAPVTLAVLTSKTWVYSRFGRWLENKRKTLSVPVATEITINTEQPDKPATPETPRVGLTDIEQADHIERFLRTIGLQHTLAPFVVMMGHGSISENNPHLAAYDCGACSGRHGGPNARAFAAIANRPAIRRLLRERGIDIPDDTWVLGAEHNTCDENIIWYDRDQIPASLQENFTHLQKGLYIATLGSAHERSRRLASAPKGDSRTKALRHIYARSKDFSQARPELGHATNAAAIIGRRSISQSAFFDRRVFLISYDPAYDPDGSIVENILLTAGPVGAGINLEYYFSAVNNDQYGCGSKVTHNVTGLLGVMQGTSSDLRTGLPKQMIEIHEAMRLQVLVEATEETLTKIYMRQPPLQQLVGNGWLLLSAIHPETGKISVFKPGEGFIPWEHENTPLTRVSNSEDWYKGHTEPLPPALIDQQNSAVKHA